MNMAAVDGEDEASRRRVRGNLLRLAVATALNGANTAVFVATGAIVGSSIAPHVSYATMPISTMVVGMAAGTLPNGWIARTHGRRAAFVAGTSCGALAGLVAAVALLVGSFWLFCFASFLGGLYASVAQSYRFAAADGASADFRAKAISWVLAGGIFAGLLGPQLVTWTMELWQPYLFVPSFLAQTAVALIAMAVLLGTDLPKPTREEVRAGRPLMQIVLSTRFAAAALCGVVSYALMNFVMTSAPLAMRMCGLTVSDSNQAIQWHVVSMFLPSFITGQLVSRFGAPRMVLVGLGITVCSALVGRSGQDVAHFWTALILLGVGWNFAFIGASTLVLGTHRPEERNKVQAFNDFIIFGLMAISSFISGGLLAEAGWDGVNMVVFPPVAIAAVVLVATGMMRRPGQVRGV